MFLFGIVWENSRVVVVNLEDEDEKNGLDGMVITDSEISN